MARKSLIDAFEIAPRSNNIKDLKDYEIFKDKTLLDSLRTKIIQNLIDSNVTGKEIDDAYINSVIDNVLMGYDLDVVERNHIFNLIQNEVSGYGPITELLDNPNITEIMVNGPNEVYVEIEGRIIKDDTISFINDTHIIRTIGRIVQPLGRTIDANNPMVDARLKDGSRLNAIIPPLSVSGPTITIRKFAKDLDDVEDMIRKGTLSVDIARFLEACVQAKLNIIVSGGTGTGKTTLLNILSSFISHSERIITIEDAAELKLKQPHVISLETRMTNYEGTGEITIRDLVRNSLRMRPDRIIVGEVRGKEAFDMMQAMNTGHEGSITTLHANSPSDALNRLETMLLMNDITIPVNAIRNYIDSAIDIIIHIERLSDGRRKITSVCEVIGMKNDIIELKEIFAFEIKGLTESKEVIGGFVQRKYIPKVYDRIVKQGILDIKDIFKK